MNFVKENIMGFVFVFMVFGITCLGAWSNERVEYNEALEQQEYLSDNLY